jgi:hypothetical protein
MIDRSITARDVLSKTKATARLFQLPQANSFFMGAHSQKKLVPRKKKPH